MEKPLPCKSRKEIARDLNISTVTLKKICAELDIPLPSRSLIKPPTYLKIYRHFGIPATGPRP
jgi:hypothetical protein